METATSGFPSARPRPFAVAAPILSPVNEPGPAEIAMASSSAGFSSICASLRRAWATRSASAFFVGHGVFRRQNSVTTTATEAVSAALSIPSIFILPSFAGNPRHGKPAHRHRVPARDISMYRHLPGGSPAFWKPIPPDLHPPHGKSSLRSRLIHPLDQGGRETEMPERQTSALVALQK